MYYKIGSLAKNFGISTQALRFYEQHGLLVAERPELGGARRYHARNFKWLYSIRRYHDLGFSMEEILTLFTCSKPEALAAYMDVKQRETRDEIALLEQRLCALERQKADLECIERLLFINELVNMPSLWLLINQDDQRVDLSPDLGQSIQEWMRFLPFVYAASIMSPEVFCHPDKPIVRQSGFCVEQEKALELGLDPGAHALSLENCRTVHTVTQLNRQNPSLKQLLSHTLDFITETGLVVNGPVVGRCLAKTGEVKCKDTLCPESVYYEYWIPVE
ncbi:MAG: MerR family transcriptional regulator [Clostridia bacterium]|nr:MerR family transcriptional regulator [Clostridia bacterium]